MGSSRWRFIDTTLKMDLTIWMSLVLAVITLGTPAQSSEPRVVCYYTNWSVYRPGTAKFNPQNINPYLCTHLIYAFGGFTKENTLKPFDKYQDIEKGGYAKFTGLKTYNKNLKTLLAIGGWNEGSSRFSPMVASRERRREFVRNAIKFLRQNRFDGLDLDWEYPAARDGSKAKDRENYAKLVKELREEFERESEKTGKPRLLLTMAVPAGIDHIKKGFDVKTLNQYLDWMNLLTYDYHSAFEPAVNHHAPLFPIEEPNEYSVDNELNIDYTIKFYIENGADADKLVLGIPTYGRSYTLFNPDAVEIGAPADGPGEQGDATREKGYLAYYEICEAVKPKQRKRSVDDEDDEDSDESSSTEVDLPWTVMNPNPKAMGPIAYRGNQWVGYDDVEMVKRKAEYVAENGLGGIMFWSVDNDDFRGNCHGKPYPLIEAAKEAYIVKLGATDNSIVTDRPQSVTRSSSKRRNRPRTTPTTTTTVKSSTAAKTLSSKRKSGSSYTSTTPAWNIVTPEPPTTPDPGSDFKCKDEGFFPHPRDCKKYFWCLDSGPSNLGIVAHQFTCPSGLFFNKAADSCDFARNVLCKKPSATTKATTKAATKAATTSSTTTTTTTTRRPIKLSTKNSVLFRTTTTTTTPEPEIEEEYEDELEDAADIEAEDPKVLKELIDLIKKVGGVEQLEKHLRLSETSASTDGATSTTPSSLNKKLYKVLERTRGKNKFGGTSASEGSSNSNSRRGPQNAGLEPSADKNVLLRKDKPQYTTINRVRPSTSTTQQSETVEEFEEEPAKDSRPASRARVVEPEVTTGTTGKTLQYVNIRRARPTYTSDTADDTASRNALFERAEPYVSVSETPSTLDILSARRENTPEYVTIRRQRPSTEETTPQYQNTELDDESQGTALEREISSQPQYTSIVRARSTTLPPPEGLASPEPTTILAVQISSLLNSPSPTEAETLATETEAPPTDDTDPTTIIVTSTSTTTKTTTTTTTEGPSVFLASTGTPRQIPLRRRGSTTLAPFTSSQVSPRNYTFISRRRPLARPNEISSDTDETNEISRKIRSTTPNSRELTEEKGSIEGPIRQIRRKRVRVRPIQDEDSVVSAASPISRGQFRPHDISPDEVVSLTPVDNEPPQFVQRPNFNQRSERRFRPRTSTPGAEKVEDNAKADRVSLPVDNETPQFIQRPNFNQRPERRFRPRTTVSDRVDDSEVSAATVDVRRPSFPSRGRSRFTVSSSTTENEAEPVTTEATSFQRRPTFARYNPRPFAKRPVPSTDETTVDPNNDDDKNTVTQRIPSRISFGKTRPSPALNNIQGRKLPFPLSRSQTTTQQALTSPSEEEDNENKNDDISLSESAIEEKEHEENNEAIEEAPKRRIVIKKLRSPAGSSDTTSTETIPINDSGKKRIKVIRRLPTSTTAAAESSDGISESTTPAVLRKRKIIRKIIRHEAEPEIIAKSIGSLNSARKDSTTEAIINYGEKTRPTLISSSTPSTTIPLTSEVEEQIKELLPEILKAESDDDNSQTDVEKNEDNNTDISAENQEGNSAINTADVLPESNNPESEAKSQLSDDESKEPPETINLEKNTNIETKQEEEDQADQTKEDNKPQVVIENEQKSVDISETETLPEEITTITKETPETTTTTTTQATPTSRTRLRPYRPSKRLFSPSTESSVPSSSKIFSRKYNPGAYTSPASADRELSRPSSTTRRPLFTPRSVARRPYTTARTTPKIPEEEEEYSEEEEILDEPEEPENKLAFVPAGQLYPRAPSFEPDTKDEEEYESVEEPEDESEERDEQFKNRFSTSTKKPTYNTPRVVNSNTFRSSTTESSQKPLSAIQNRTAVFTRFGQNKPIDDTKKRVQNVPSGYNIPVAPTVNTQNTDNTTDEIRTTTTDAETEIATVDDDYLSMTEATSVTFSENTSEDVTSTNVIEKETTTYGTMETNADNDDYMEYTGPTTNYPSTQFNSESDSIINLNTDVTPESSVEITTNSAKVAPIVKTQFNKLFSVSRVVEVNSKLNKHRLNKNNETTLVEEGKIMVEKKPVVDKIGEVSRFSFIKIVEDDIPIYLTKLGHVYPAENLPDNLIRIDEARNARALSNFADAPKENLVASESINEGYRHIKQSDRDITVKDRVEHIPGDDFLSYINEDKKSGKSEDLPYPSHWQFVPAAYESDKDDQPKAAKSFEIITPRTMLTDPSTLPLEALFQTERPLTARKMNDNRGNQPFVVYSASLPTQKEEGNLVKLQVVKPETSRSIITFAKGQEFNGGSVADESTIKYPVNISVLPRTTESTSTVSTTMRLPSTESMPTKPTVELLTTTQTTTPSSVSPTLATTTEIPTTTETIPEETTTQKSTPLDTKRSKFSFPRRPIIKPSNITRPIPRTRTIKKLNSTTLNSSLKTNKTSGFVPNKSRFTGNRAQNVPTDGRKSTPKPKTFSTESPRTTTERKLFFKPIRPAFRPAFVLRKSLTTTPATTGDT